MNLIYMVGESVTLGRFSTSYDFFNILCSRLSLSNPLVVGEYCIVNSEGYSPINEEGHHGEQIELKEVENKEAYLTLLSSETLFINEAKVAQEEQYKEYYKSLPLSTKLQDAYTEVYPIHQQIEALRDALNGDSTKLDAMNASFAAKKAEITEKHNKGE